MDKYTYSATEARKTLFRNLKFHLDACWGLIQEAKNNELSFAQVPFSSDFYTVLKSVSALLRKAQRVLDPAPKKQPAGKRGRPNTLNIEWVVGPEPEKIIHFAYSCPECRFRNVSIRWTGRDDYYCAACGHVTNIKGLPL